MPNHINGLIHFEKQRLTYEVFDGIKITGIPEKIDSNQQIYDLLLRLSVKLFIISHSTVMKPTL